VQAEKQLEQYLYLTTRGRKTGLHREIEIWFTAHDKNYYVMAEYPTSHWVQNLRANPRVQVRVREQTFAAQARILSNETEPGLFGVVRDLFQKKYGWGEGLPVELIPQASR
jgi:deazaflavin-dependent oxidoreductase (nitroreductase family)